MSDLVNSWRERIRAASAAQSPLRLVGGGTKDFYGQELDRRAVRDGGTSGHRRLRSDRIGHYRALRHASCRDRTGVGRQAPDARVRAATFRCRTRRSVDALPPACRDPAGPYAGAVRDTLLGVRMLDGRGDDLSFGGRVMKNVAGFDVSRLIAGSLGTLGVILEASLKCLPSPSAESTIVQEMSVEDSLRRFNEWGGMPLPISGTCWYRGRAFVRLSGAAKRSGRRGEAHRRRSSARCRRVLDGRTRAAAPLFRRTGHATVARVRTLHRPPASGWRTVDRMGWRVALALRDKRRRTDAAVRAWAAENGGHATLFRGADKSEGVFQPLPAPMLMLHQRLKSALDPVGVFNPRRMYAAF